ncbi:MAG TPA: hypothetical protein VEY89_14340 [Candidatus Dormibacteraeota bacterium]|nr:hypothetical protein [Candidatus Dormibacteraeota bacterium]
MQHRVWRRALRRELGWLLAAKLLALALLWWLFFSPPHRVAVDAAATLRQLGVMPAPAAHPGARGPRG